MSDYLRFIGPADDRSQLTIISSPFTFHFLYFDK